jgi:hypothetical protein
MKARADCIPGIFKKEKCDRVSGKLEVTGSDIVFKHVPATY